MAPPANDNFASAIALSTTLPGSRTADTTVDATNESGEPTFADGEHSVWYTYTPTSTGRYRFRVDNTTATIVWTDTRNYRLSIYTGSTVGGLTELVAVHRFSPSSDGLITWGIVEYLLTSGVTYHIRMSSPFFTGEGANAHAVQYNLNWESKGNPSAPANDNFANAVDLGTDPANGLLASPTTVGATDEAGGFSYNGGTPSVWYKFHCATTESQPIHLVRNGADPYYVPYWEIHRKTSAGTPTSWSDLTFVTSGDLDQHTQIDDSSATASLVAGNDYYIFVGNWEGDGVTGASALWFGTPAAPPSPPANDVMSALNSAPLFHYWPSWLAYSEYVVTPNSTELADKYAGAVDGTTVAATATGGDPATIAGFAATRNVWYVLDIAKAGSYKIWAESSVDCVLGLFNKSGTALGSLIAQDDDSGAGNWPEITQTLAIGSYWVVVDSKTEGTFRLKWQLQIGGSHPANDDFANATVISAIPYSVAGTTVGATAEPDDHYAPSLGQGPKDTVWYKYVATGNGTLKVYATCDSANLSAAVNVDVWKGTVFKDLVPNPLTPSGSLKAYFNHFYTADQIKARKVTVDLVSGQTYYIRVQTQDGGSEDFTIFVDVNDIYLDLQASGAEEMHGTLLDAVTVPLRMVATAVEDFHQTLTTDAVTVPLDLVASGVDIKAFAYTEAATARVKMTAITEHECIFHLEPSWIFGGIRKWQWNGSSRRWAVTDPGRRWAWVEGEGQPQIC